MAANPEVGHPIRRRLLLVAMAVVSLVFIYPLIYTVIASFKDSREIFTNPFGLPATWLGENFAKAWVQAKLQRYLVNSAFLTVVTTLFHLLFGSMAAYAITRFRRLPLTMIGGLLALGMMIPIQAILIPITRMAVAWGGTNQYWFLLCVYIAGGLPTTVFVISAYLRSFPSELEEAATIDGCGPWSFYWRVLLPLSKPALVTMGIISFISTWNELLVALVLISKPELKTLPLGLLNFTGAYSTDWAGLCAAIVITVIPTLIIYLLLQESVERGLTEGAVKG